MIGPTNPITGCAKWFGPAPQGRPIIRHGTRTMSAIRAIYEKSIRKLGRHEVVVNTCGDPLCVSVAHMKVLTRSELAKISACKMGKPRASV